MAEVDDGDFGDFKFAPSHPNPTDNDDEWGDFFSHSPPKTLPSSQSLPVFPDAPIASQIHSEWPRRQAALPLSIFGEEEDDSLEEQSDPTFFPPKTPNSIRKSSSLSAGVPLNDLIGDLYDQINPQNQNPNLDSNTISGTVDSSFEVGKGLNDSIGNSYDQIKPPNGLSSNSNGLDLKPNVPISATANSSPPKSGNYLRKTSSLGMELNDLFADSYNQSHQINPQNDLNSKTNSTGVDANLSPLQPSNSMRKASSFSVVEELNDLMGNFDQSHLQNRLNSNSTIQSTTATDNYIRKASSLNGGGGMGLNDLIAHLYDQSNLVKPQNGLDMKTDETITEVNGQSFGLNSDLNGLNQESGDANEYIENDDDDGWEFKVAETETETGPRDGTSLMKVDGNGQQSSGRSDNAYDIGNGTCTDDLFGAPAVTCTKSGEWDFGFDFNPNFGTQDGISSSYAINKPNDTTSGTDLSPSGDKLDSDDFIWEFKNSSSEVWSAHKLKEAKVADVFPAGKALAVGDTANASNGSIDASDMVSHGSLDFEFSFNPSSIEGGSDSYKSKQNDISNGLTSSSVDVNVKYDGNLLGFNDSVPETGLKHQTSVDDKQKLCENGLDSIMFSSQDVGNDYGQNSWEFRGVIAGIKAEDKNFQNSGLDSSMFSPQKGEDDLGQNSWEFKDPFSGTKAEDQTPVNSIQNHIGDASDPAKTILSSVLVNDDDDFGVDSWEFMGALPVTSAKEQTYDSDTHTLCENGSEFNTVPLQPNLADAHGIPWDLKDGSSGSKVEDKSPDRSCEDLYKRHSTTLEADKYLHLYEKLKDELCYMTTYHLDNLKKKQSNDDALSSEDAKDKAPCDGIQEIYNELHQENIELHSEDISEINSCLNELLEVLKEPIFQMIESEYNISERLSVAAKDLRSTIELLKHVVLTLKILGLGSAEEQFSYVSTWHRIISVCAEELEHGASIWNQSLQKNVHNHILSEPQGKSYILGLGEIYRVVEVVGASAKLYKPWVLSCSANPTAFFALVNKCCALWSSSGIEEALNSLSDPIDFRYDGTISELQASIKAINDLDEHTLKKHVLPQQEPICRLSLLSPDSALGLKLVLWDQEHYFLKVANLWANLVSHDPPNLPHIQVG